MAVLVSLCSLCVLCGCTKKEELILLTPDVQEGQKVRDDSGSEPEDMTGFERRQEDQAGLEMAQKISGDSEQTIGTDESAAYIVEEQRTLYVHVCGAVMAPGVYELPAGSRVYEAVQAAGGFTENAEESYVNQAQQLTDGGKLLIPTVEEVQNGKVPDTLTETEDGPGNDRQTNSGTQTGVDDGRININTASVEELCRIPGIGATRAAAIISYRENHGSFGRPEDIMQVSGIKEGTYEKIKDSIRVE